METDNLTEAELRSHELAARMQAAIASTDALIAATEQRFLELGIDINDTAQIEQTLARVPPEALSRAEAYIQSQLQATDAFQSSQASTMPERSRMQLLNRAI